MLDAARRVPSARFRRDLMINIAASASRYLNRSLDSCCRAPRRKRPSRPSACGCRHAPRSSTAGDQRVPTRTCRARGACRLSVVSSAASRALPTSIRSRADRSAGRCSAVPSTSTVPLKFEAREVRRARAGVVDQRVQYCDRELRDRGLMRRQERLDVRRSPAATDARSSNVAFTAGRVRARRP